MAISRVNRFYSSAAVALAAVSCAGCGAVTRPAQPHLTTTPSSRPAERLHLVRTEHLRLSGIVAADVATAVVADCPDSGAGLQLLFDAAGRRWVLLIIFNQALANDRRPSPGSYDLFDPTQSVLALDRYQAARPEPFTSPTPGPVEHFGSTSGAVTIAADRRSGTVRAALTDQRSGPVDVRATPTPPVVIERIDGSWTC